MKDLVSYLYSLSNFRKKAYHLDSMQQMLDELDLQKLPCFCIHVAGTNGKGSVCHKIANALFQSGYKTGIFTSPHISTYRERIVINQEMIPEKVAEKILHQILSAFTRKKISPTFFEIMTLLSLLYFKEEKIEYAVIETGLGGRLDATNVVSPILSVITSISLDHTHILGKTLDEIAREKAGIIKEKVPIVIGPRAHLPPILQRAKEKKCPVFSVKGSFSFYEEENRMIAKKALCYVKKISTGIVDIKTNIHSNPSCRFERYQNMVFDVAHNTEGFTQLIKGLKKFFPNKKFCFLLGICKDKNIPGIFSLLDQIAEVVFLLSHGERLCPIALLAKHCKKIPCLFEDSLESTTLEAKKHAEKNKQILVITGSFYLMHPVKKCLQLPLASQNPTANEKLL